MTPFIQTPSQTVGPYFAYGLTPEQYGYDHASVAGSSLFASQEETKDEQVIITGRVLDGEGKAIPDAMVEIWQADANGLYPNGASSTQHFGRVGTGTDAQNRFIFQTIKPGPVQGQAPHITIIVFMRGLLVHAYTRLYFPEETEANQRDEVLNSVPAQRRSTLLSQRIEKGGRVEYYFDIRMQGYAETVFFDV